MSKIFSVLFLFTLANYYCSTTRVDNICSTRHIKRLFLRLGESGVLTAHNITREVSRNGSLHENCQVEIVTCPSCIISLTFRLMNLNCYCGPAFNLFFYNPCRCDYIWITEPPYGSASGMSFCRIIPSSGGSSTNLNFKSKTKILRVSLFYSRSYVQAFTADYKSEPNRQVWFGISQNLLEQNYRTEYISSPFFPATYPRDMTSEYVLTCIKPTNFSSREVDAPVEEDSNCRVHLLFTDFQLASSSFVEFFEGSRQVKVVRGISFRPPVIVSETNSLSIRFCASGQSSIGFKAVFSFVSQRAAEKMARPSTDCGGNIDNFGGTISMSKMVSSRMKLFDCIWLIKPLKNIFNVKSHLYLKVAAFLNFAGDAELQIRQGLTSESPVVEKLRSPVSQNFREHIIPFKSGYYINLRALFSAQSHFAIAYASFSQNKCLILSEFLCKNFRCITKKLVCDGFDHCGDNSDEPGVCFQEWSLEPETGRWLQRTLDNYLPKTKQDSELKTAFVFLISIVSLIFFIAILITVLYRIRSKAREGREFHDQMQSVSDLQDCVSDEILIEEVFVDDPPSYEPPPQYEEVVKISSPHSSCDDDQLNSTKLW